jgi:hypothetical protein
MAKELGKKFKVTIMAIIIDDYDVKWKKVSGNFKKSKQTCLRCNNEVQYELCSASEGFGFGPFVLLPINTCYVYKCPICPVIEPLSKQVAKAIMKGA